MALIANLTSADREFGRQRGQVLTRLLIAKLGVTDQALAQSAQITAADLPAVIIGHQVLRRATTEQMGQALGLAYRHTGTKPVDLIVVGSGPAGLAAAVYGAAEGLDTVVLDAAGRRRSAMDRVQRGRPDEMDLHVSATHLVDPAFSPTGGAIVLAVAGPRQSSPVVQGQQHVGPLGHLRDRLGSPGAVVGRERSDRLQGVVAVLGVIDDNADENMTLGNETSSLVGAFVVAQSLHPPVLILHGRNVIG
ncbi:MAG: thioredoxin reductase [Mycobacterium sp.]|nr:thioredoxin reductase [Mycobacterium sp.]